MRFIFGTVTLLILSETANIFTSASSKKHPYVQTKYGLLNGQIRKVNGKEIATYFGVPFAKPPTDELRLRPPQKLTPWTGTKDVKHLSRACIQPPDTTYEAEKFWGSEMWNPNTEQDEDCLHMNIWVPVGATNATVMAWFFGGGFYSGSPSLEVYDATGLAAEGQVIVVNINYRVGALGFLFLDHPDAPGNLGLLDQRLALEWIQENIQEFGGDPSQVVLFGESAGAASVVAHMIAPDSRSLFKSGILQSGSIQNPWAMDHPERALFKSKAFLKAANCDKDNMSEAVKCLKDLPAEKFRERLYNETSHLYFMEFPLVIVSQDRNFFKRDAYRALEEGDFKVTSLMIGVMADEGTYWVVYNLPHTFSKSNIENLISRTQFVKSLEIVLNRESDLVKSGAVTKYDVLNCSLGSDKPSREYTNAVSQLVGDYEFTCDALWFADKLVERGGNVYVYHFTHRVSSNPWPLWMGVMHAYELEFVFGAPLVNRTHRQGTYTDAEVKFSREVIQYWTSFARNSAPRLTSGSAPAWPRYEAARHKYLSLGPGSKYIAENLKGSECRFWHEVYEQRYKLVHMPRTSGSIFISKQRSLEKLLLLSINLILCASIYCELIRLYY